MDNKIILISSAVIAILALFAAGSGLLLKDTYKNDTISGAAQEQGNDLVTIIFCIPLLLISAAYAANGSLRGRLVWTGAVFFFLYTYASQSFLTAYNHMFLIYVATFSLSLYTFAYSTLTLDTTQIKENFTNAPVKATAALMFLVGTALLFMWIGGIILPSLLSGERPPALETYTTLVIQALDLGVIAPIAMITGYLLLKREAWGYTLASLVLIKGITLGTGVISMGIFEIKDGVDVAIPMLTTFMLMTLGTFAITILFYSKMKNPTSLHTTVATPTETN
ncbi:MAG TPA: hypothetical protein VK436_12505 [Methanocella sp.]|nr:hypothetical protein [Methanocella sp.]